MKIIFALLMLTFAVQTNAERPEAVNISNSGNDFMTVCKPTENPVGDKLLDAVLCFGFVQGFNQGLRASEELEQTPGESTKRICIPEDVTVQQTLRVIAKFIDEHPEISNNPTRHLAYTALARAFRCKTSGTSPN